LLNDSKNLKTSNFSWQNPATLARKLRGFQAQPRKNPAGANNMFKKMSAQTQFEAVELRIEGQLDPDNQWVFFAKRLPWQSVEEKYAENFKKDAGGEVALSVRIAMGALLIKQWLGLSDRKTVDAIKENPYLQHFLGLPGFQSEAPFHHSMMTYFRNRLPPEAVDFFNEKIIELAQNDRGANTANGADDPHDPHTPPPPGATHTTQTSPPSASCCSDAPASAAPSAAPSTAPSAAPSAAPSVAPSAAAEPPANSGTLLLDATCAPADIPYPTDLNLVNDAREMTEAVLDEARLLSGATTPRPRTRREVCRARYLSVAKHPKCGASKRRKALRFLLNALRRNLGFIHLHDAALAKNEKLLEKVKLLQTVHDQQRAMLDSKTHRVEHRVVNLHQPHVRPIVRGKAGRETEFGAKLTASVEDGFARVERLSWEAYNEGGDLQSACESYKARTGHYPEAVLADKIFRTRENLSYCAARGIRLSGPRLGRPPKETDPSVLRQQLADNSVRNAIEGKFGQCKRSLGLDRVMARAKSNSETVIHMAFLVANLIRWHQEAVLRFLRLHFSSCDRFHFPALLLDPAHAQGGFGVAA
jgi:IS5 family transposase